ncbi:hypothetical protein Srut_29040 [Streptomyces rutgersensis]|nr:hypothetical protein Srut_29040 [Streptomyces rutgersensis]
MPYRLIRPRTWRTGSGEAGRGISPGGVLRIPESLGTGPRAPVRGPRGRVRRRAGPEADAPDGDRACPAGVVPCDGWDRYHSKNG